MGIDVGNGLGGGECPIEVSQIKAGMCYHLTALYKGKKMELGVYLSLIHRQPHRAGMRLKTLLEERRQ